MALKTKVTNSGDSTFDKVVNGTRYTIDPGQTVTLPRRTAIAIRGHYTPPGERVNITLEHIPAEEQRYSCHFCGIEFPDQSTLDKHLKTHQDKVVKIDNKSPKQEKVYVAPDGEEFKSKQALLSHMRAVAKKESNDSGTDQGHDS